MAAPPTTRPALWTDGLAGVVLLVLPVLLLVGQRDLSPTIDEPLHTIRGLAWWWTGTARLSYAHPPVANILMTAPAAWWFDPVDLTALQGWSTANHWGMAQELARNDYVTLKAWITMSRWTGVLIAQMLAGSIYLWTRRRMGPVTALLAMGLVAFNPSLLAHAQLVTTDLPVVATYTLAALAFIDYLLQVPTALEWRRHTPLAVFAIAVAVALCTKFSALVLVPFFLLGGALYAWRGWGRFAGEAGPKRLQRLAVEVAVVGAVCVLLVNALYRFEGTMMTGPEILAVPEPICYLTDNSNELFLERHSQLRHLPSWLPIPVPYTYLFGAHMVANQMEGHLGWFMGQASRGHWAYYPVLLLVKTPFPVWIGLLCLLVEVIRARRIDAPRALLAAAAGSLLVLLSFSKLNVGVRHALPVVPALTILSASGLAWAYDSLPRWHRAAGAILAALVLWTFASAATNTAYYLSWFNIGPERGHWVSVLGEDWGQDAARLARYAKEHQLEVVHYHRYGEASAAELRLYDVPSRRIRCGRPLPRTGWLAVHQVQLKRRPACYPKLVGPPDAVINHHILLWDLEAQADKRAKRAQEQLDALRRP